MDNIRKGSTLSSSFQWTRIQSTQWHVNNPSAHLITSTPFEIRKPSKPHILRSSPSCPTNQPHMRQHLTFLTIAHPRTCTEKSTLSVELENMKKIILCQGYRLLWWRAALLMTGHFYGTGRLLDWCLLRILWAGTKGNIQQHQIWGNIVDFWWRPNPLNLMFLWINKYGVDICWVAKTVSCGDG